MLLQHAGRLWVGAGSDHTDREVEKYGVTVSKQMCEKPVAPLFWAYDAVAAHWDRLELRAHVTEGGRRTLYQEGAVTAMLDPRALIARLAASLRSPARGGRDGEGLPEGTLMFCGTLAARGGVRATGEFDFELEDPVHPAARVARPVAKERRDGEPRIAERRRRKRFEPEHDAVGEQLDRTERSRVAREPPAAKGPV